MEVLQVKLSRAEERLFGSEGNGQSQQPQQQQQQQQRDGDRFFSSSFVQSPGVNNVRMEEDKSRDMDHLLQRLLSAEEEMRREQELLVALDKKQQLIDAQEEKVIIVKCGTCTWIRYQIINVECVALDCSAGFCKQSALGCVSTDQGHVTTATCSTTTAKDSTTTCIPPTTPSKFIKLHDSCGKWLSQK